MVVNLFLPLSLLFQKLFFCEVYFKCSPLPVVDSKCMKYEGSRDQRFGQVVVCLRAGVVWCVYEGGGWGGGGTSTDEHSLVDFAVALMSRVFSPGTQENVAHHG